MPARRQGRAQLGGGLGVGGRRPPAGPAEHADSHRGAVNQEPSRDPPERARGSVPGRDHGIRRPRSHRRRPPSSTSPAASSATGVRQLNASGGPDAEQVLAYDLAHAAAGVATARSMLEYGAKGDVEATVTCAFVADVVHDLLTRLAGREALWGVDAGAAATAPAPSWRRTATRRSWPRWPASTAPATSTPTSSWCRTRSAASPTRRSPRSPSTSTAPTATCPRRSSPAWARWAPSACRCPSSTAAGPAAASTTTSAWWWPPRSCRGDRSASAARSSPGPRSSPAPW